MIPRLLAAGFSRRLTLLMLLATIPAMLGSNWILSRKAANYLTAAATEKLAATTDKLGKSVDAWVDDVGRELQVFSRDPDIVSMNPRRQRLRLLQLHNAFPQITFSFTTGPDGLNVARADDKPPINYGDLDWFHRVMAGAPIARETLVKARTTGRPGLYQAAPILGLHGKIVGVIALGMDLGALGDVVCAARYGSTGYSCLVDEQGRAVRRTPI